MFHGAEAAAKALWGPMQAVHIAALAVHCAVLEGRLAETLQAPSPLPVHNM